MSLQNRIVFAAICILFPMICNGQTIASAQLPYPLPTKARYQVTDEQVKNAVSILSKSFGGNPAQLQGIMARRVVCGPGLWQLIKDSPHMNPPPHAKTAVVLPLANGQTKQIPAAMLQSDGEISQFSQALADLIRQDGTFTFRLPTQSEFKLYWTFIPFDDISDALIVAESTNHSILIQFTDGKPLWFDELKTVSSIN